MNSVNDFWQNLNIPQIQGNSPYPAIFNGALGYTNFFLYLKKPYAPMYGLSLFGISTMFFVSGACMPSYKYEGPNMAFGWGLIYLLTVAKPSLYRVLPMALTGSVFLATLNYGSQVWDDESY